MIVTVLIAAALVIALVTEFQADGRDLLGWAVVLTDIALLVARGLP